MRILFAFLNIVLWKERQDSKTLEVGKNKVISVCNTLGEEAKIEFLNYAILILIQSEEMCAMSRPKWWKEGTT